MIKNADNANVCPFNFEKFTDLNNKVGNIEASILLCKIKYHQQFSSFKKGGKTWAILNRNQIASWFALKPKKTDKLLNLLVNKGLITKDTSTWYGTKKLIFTTNNIDNIPVNFNILNDLVKQTGSIKAALFFSHIAFRFANSIINRKARKWCCINQKTLATWGNCDIKTIYNILKILEQKNLITKALYAWNNKPQTHFHVPKNIIENLQKHWEKSKQPPNTLSTKPIKLKISLNSPKQTNNSGNTITTEKKVKINPAYSFFSQLGSGKKGISIIRNTNTKKNNNNTCSDIIFKNSNLDTIGDELTHRQSKYLDGAIKNTVDRKNLKISDTTELKEWLKFSILEATQRKSITSFKHAVSSFMKILADGRYNMPIGFSKYSDYGIKMHKYRREQEKKWQDLKKTQIQRSSIFDFDNTFLQTKSDSTSDLTDKALKIASKIAELSKVEVKPTIANAVYNMIGDLQNKLENLISQGADRDAIKNYYQQEFNAPKARGSTNLAMYQNTSKAA